MRTIHHIQKLRCFTTKKNAIPNGLKKMMKSSAKMDSRAIFFAHEKPTWF